MKIKDNETKRTNRNRLGRDLRDLFDDMHKIREKYGLENIVFKLKDRKDEVEVNIF